jgi:hypothetical protein
MLPKTLVFIWVLIQINVYFILKLILGLQPNYLINFFTILEKNNGRDAPHTM